MLTRLPRTLKTALLSATLLAAAAQPALAHDGLPHPLAVVAQVHQHVQHVLLGGVRAAHPVRVAYQPAYQPVYQQVPVVLDRDGRRGHDRRDLVELHRDQRDLAVDRAQRDFHERREHAALQRGDLGAARYHAVQRRAEQREVYQGRREVHHDRLALQDDRHAGHHGYGH